MSDVAKFSYTQWTQEVSRLVDGGEFFKAYDLGAQGLSEYPNDILLAQKTALAASKVGMYQAANDILEPFNPYSDSFSQTNEHLREVISAMLEEESEKKASAVSKKLDTLLDSLTRTIGKRILTTGANSNVLGAPIGRQTAKEQAETIGILASNQKQKWIRSQHPEDLLHARDLYLKGFHLTQSYYNAINAAALSWIAGEHDLVEDILGQVPFIVKSELEQARKNGDKNEEYWCLVTLAESYLLLGSIDAAKQYYKKATENADLTIQMLTSVWQQLDMLARHGLKEASEAKELLEIPNIVVFTGHMLDMPGRAKARFPAQDRRLERQIRQAIDEQLDKLNIAAGYCSAACGADILFIEAMQNRNDELHIVLPFDREDFIRTSVCQGGHRWLHRFDRALQLVDTSLATDEGYLNTETLFEFGFTVLKGLATLRAHSLGITPKLLAVWDGVKQERPGGTYYNIKRWPHHEDITIIPMSPPFDEQSAEPQLCLKDQSLPEPITSQQHLPREIKAMLFADVVGYSSLSESHIPAFMHTFLEKIAQDTRGVPRPDMVNTWGDAIFAVMDRESSILDMTEYALTLLAVVQNTNWKSLGLPKNMNIRIALHYGPVYRGIDAITGRENYFGSHVNRAARIEPITQPGCIYISDTFASFLVLAMQNTWTKGVWPYDLNYVGKLALPKGFGSQRLYHLQPTNGKSEING